MLRKLILFFAFGLATISTTFVNASPEWSSREPGESWEQALSRYSDEREERDLSDLLSSSSALNSARLYKDNIDVSALPEWRGSEAQLRAAFETLRDERIYTQRGRSGFLRRSTWLYPNDGCFARAVHSARSLKKHNFTRPGKVFAFGNLRLATKYDSRGAVYWWYHVVSAYRYRNTALVLDPAVDPLKPLTLKQWLSRISRNIHNVKVSTCDTYAYVPGSRCIGGSSNQERSAVSHQLSYLPKEWNRLRQLRMNPERLLGDDPPWRSRVLSEAEF